MKKILFITAYTPSNIAASEKNTKILLEDLAESFEVDLVYARYKKDLPYIPKSGNIRIIKVFQNSLLIKIVNCISYPFVYPIFSVRFNWSRIRILQKLINANNYDAIIFEHNQSFLFAKFLKTSCPNLLYCHDVLYQKISRVSGKLMSHFCKWSEKYCFNVKKSQIYSISQKDCDLIQKWYGLLSQPALAYIEPQIIAAKPTKIKNNDYTFMANWARADNYKGLIWFFEKVAPLIDFPVNINIIGKNLKYNYDGSNPNIIVNYLGFVEDPYPLLSNSRAFLSPLFSGAGVKQKVFEALACGVPVIGNEIAFEGLDLAYQKYMLHFDSELDFIECMKVSIPLNERLELKKTFSNSYRSKTIPMYLKEMLKI